MHLESSGGAPEPDNKTLGNKCISTVALLAAVTFPSIEMINSIYADDGVVRFR